MSANSPLVTDTQQQDRRRKRKAILAGGMVLGLGAAVTLAAWSDDVFAGGTFGTGEFVLQGNASIINGDTEGFDVYESVDESAPLDFELDPGEVAPGDINYAPLALRVAGTENGLISIPNVTNSNALLDDFFSYTIYSGVQPAACNVGDISGGLEAYTGGMGEAGTAVAAVTAPQLSATPAGTPLCIVVATNEDQSLPQGEDTTITWQFQGTSIDGS